MRLLLILTFLLSPTAAFADPGTIGAIATYLGTTAAVVTTTIQIGLIVASAPYGKGRALRKITKQGEK